MENEVRLENGITQGVIWKQILIFFFPILIGTFFQQLYNTADAAIVGHFVGKEALSAVGGPTGTLINVLIGFFVGLSSGATVIIAQYYGGKQESSVKRSVHTAIALSILGGIFIMIIGTLFSPIALKAMGTPEDIMNYAITYIRVYFAGTIFNLLYNIGAGILRAIGDSKRPLYFLIVACFINIGLDLLFVAVFDLGVFGAALATILSQMVSSILIMLVLIKSKESYHVEPKQIRLDIKTLKEIFRIGLPAGLQSMMYSVSNVIIQTGVNGFGTDIVAAWTAYSKMDGFFWMTISAFGISITTFVGQNYGAGLDARVRKGIRVCMLMSMIATVILSTFLYFACPFLLRLFTSDSDVIIYGIQLVRFLAPVYFTYVTIEILSGALRGTGDSLVPMLMTCIGICVFRIVWVFFIAPMRPTINTLLFNYPASWILTTLLFVIYIRWFSRLKKGATIYS